MVKKNKMIGIVCVALFAITALTSVPLFVNYLIGSEPANKLIVDLHVWIGAFYILIASIRMIKNKAFLKEDK